MAHCRHCDSLQTSSTQLKLINEQLFDARAELQDAHRQLLETPTVDISIVINKEFRLERATLMDASARLASKASLIAETPLHLISLQNDDVFFTMKNAKGHLLKQLNYSTHLFEERLQDNFDNTSECNVVVASLHRNLTYSSMFIVSLHFALGQRRDAFVRRVDALGHGASDRQPIAVGAEEKSADLRQAAGVGGHRSTPALRRAGGSRAFHSQQDVPRR